ncbi:MAG: hypothetical protein EWV40_04870 [Microcystis flos-aquae Mf_WU_F_19750830_S460]|uniref:Uncharacterized protein n=1 Tax=Microcystis flos-aquae Mf_WU_F_19750830_S460 TaxID=2486237 RepID=A0A552LZ41_9CHRO|nr:hypothetical protein [Microcystis aeruginosa]TRV25475.1 MAG: hypothetical protein EWV40_04870 [Microcystis flos-aquae Mf_WU_F_19750830_S460]
MGFLKGKSLLKLGFVSDFITQSQPLRVSTPRTPLGRTGLCDPPRVVLDVRGESDSPKGQKALALQVGCLQSDARTFVLFCC